MSDSAALLLAAWRAEGVVLNAGASKKDLAQLEEEIGHRLPVPMRSFYLEYDGMQDGSSDSIMFGLWPISRILDQYKDSITAVSPRAWSRDVLAFADFLIDSHHYAVTLAGPDAGSIVIDHGVQRPSQVASDWDTFLEQVLRSSEELLMFPRERAAGA